MKSFVVESADKGVTLAAFLRARCELPWSRARTLCERGKVQIDGVVCHDSAARLTVGQRVSLDESAPVRSAPPPGRIVFDDAQVVVFEKPEGVSSVPFEPRELGTALDLIRAHWRAAGKKATSTPLHIVHRIDKDTSGLIVFAKSKLAERALAAQFRSHTVGRVYLCVAHGRVTATRFESVFLADRGDGLRGTLHPRWPKAGKGENGKRAVTLVQPREAWRRASLCEVRLETGRTHQIRIHLAEAGHPLVGERVYIRDFAGALIESPRLLLHAHTLSFVHPVTARTLSFTSELPASFTSVADALRAER